MTIYCNRCELRLTSLLLDDEARIRDCFSQLERHIHYTHRDTIPEFQKELGLVGGLIMTYLLIHKYALIPVEETKLLATHNKVIETILKVLEIEITETEEEKKEHLTELNPAG